MLWRRALLRARSIYLYHICAFIVLFVVIKMFAQGEWHWSSWNELLNQRAFVGFILGLTLLAQPRFMDILPMYCAFILITPAVIKMFRKSKTNVVLAISVSLWAIVQILIQVNGSTLGSWLHHKCQYISLGAFDIFAWQLLFIFGLYCGFRCFTERDKCPYATGPVLVYLGAIATFFCLSAHRLLLPDWIVEAIASMSDKPSLGIFRVLNFVAVFFLLAAVYKKMKNGLFVEGLAYIGRHSLQVFIWQIFVIYAVDLTFDRFGMPSKATRTVILIFCLASLYCPAFIVESIKRRTR